MNHKKVMAILLALICTAAIALGGCSTHSQEAGTLHSSVSEQDKNNSSVGTPKNGQESQDSLSESDNTETDANAKNDNVNITSDSSNSGKSSENSSSSKTSGNSSSGKASGSSGSGSSASNNGSSKSSGSSSSGKASGSSGAKQPSSNSGSSTSNKTSASHSGSSGSSSSSSSGSTSKPSKPAQPVHHHNWVQHYTTKTIPEVSHYEKVKKYVCNGCGAQFDDGHSAIAHCGADFWDACENYTYKVVDSHKVVDQPAQTVKVPDYKYCTGCDARQ